MQIWAPFASAYWMAWMMEAVVPLPSEPPRAFTAMTLTRPLWTMPAMPVPLSALAAMVPAPWVPWASSAPA